MFSRMELVYLQGGQKHRINFNGASAGTVRLQLDCSSLEKMRHGEYFRVNLVSEEPLELIDFQVELTGGLGKTKAMLVNGFQSWSGSTELGPSGRIPPPFRGVYPIFAPYGDYRFTGYSGRRGRLHSWTYTYFIYPDERLLLLGSVDESDGYTLFNYDYGRDRLVIRRECTGAAVERSYPLLRLYVGQGDADQVFDEYFSLMKLPRGSAPRVTGWTSWYNYYTGISEEIVHHNLKELSRLKLPLEYFQVDDGWQKAVGDWLEVNHKFPSGLAALAAAIREKGFKPGLWLAPFICERRSRVFKEHPEWLLRHKNGKPVKAGFNPQWSGFFYALNFYAPGFQDYLKEVLCKMQEEWGFELLKLDFLYAAALLPGPGKSRGRVMNEAMEFIHQQAGNSKLLGCGVPLGPSMGRVDYCRIGSDVAPFWEFPARGLNYRERISTVNSLTSTIARRHLDRRAFRNDPDVFLLRDGVPKKNLNRLTFHQRQTLYFLNNLFGGLVFFSDNVDEYTREQLQILRSSYPVLETRIGRVEKDRDLYRIEFTVGKKRYLAFANLSRFSREIILEEGLYFNPELFVLRSGSRLKLEPYRTVCFYRIEPREDRAYLLGSSGHIYPGAQVQRLIARPGNVTLQLHAHASPGTRVYLGVPRGMVNLRVNKENYAVSIKDNLHFITVTYGGKNISSLVIDQ